MFPLMGFDIRGAQPFSTPIAILQEVVLKPFREIGTVLLKVSEMSKVKTNDITITVFLQKQDPQT